MIGSPACAQASVERMEELLTGHFVAQCLQVVASLGIPDIIGDAERSSSTIARDVDCDALAIARLSRMLTSVGVFEETRPGLFRLTPLGATLRSNAAGSLRYKAIWEVSEPIWDAWAKLGDVVRNGKPSFPVVHNASVYQYLGHHVSLGSVFNRFMNAQSAQQNQAILEAYDFTGIEMLADIGGGQGATLRSILERHPKMRGVLFDLPEVVSGALASMASVTGRFDIVAGNMLQAVPAGADAYLIKRVMMDKSDDEAISLLRNCSAAMRPGGRILVVDPVLPSAPSQHPNYVTDLLMMVLTSGRCRTEQEFGDLFERAGLKVTRVIPTRSPNFIVEAN